MGQIKCTHVCKWKNETCKTVAGMWGRGMEENGGGGNSSMKYLIYGKNFWKCHNVLPPSTTIKK
jgi:hypothetical protein